MAILFTAYYPAIIGLIFLLVFALTPMPAKGSFFLRAMTALIVAVFLAHVNRIFDFYPAHRLFPSGHTTFCAGMTWSMAMLRPWTLFFTIPLLIAMGAGLVYFQFHTRLDVYGAFPLVLIIYGTLHTWWRLPGDAAHLDRAIVSP